MLCVKYKEGRGEDESGDSYTSTVTVHVSSTNMPVSSLMPTASFYSTTTRNMARSEKFLRKVNKLPKSNAPTVPTLH